jgi:hypothetical protein
LLAQDTWHGDVPAGITGVFRSTTSTGVVIPRVFQDDTPEDKAAVQQFIDGIDLYPLAEFDGKLKRRDWKKLPVFPAQAQTEGETKWVDPQKVFNELPAVLEDAAALPGEVARYAQLLAVLDASQKDPALRKAMIDEAAKADAEIIGPMFDYRNWGIQFPHYWSGTANGAEFGTDYFSRTANAKANIFINKPIETRYFGQDLDEAGGRLNGGNRYTVTFAKGQLPPVRGFWSLTLYNTHHFFSPNDLKRYSLGTKNKSLVYNDDGSLTLYVQADAPDAKFLPNWLPAPKGADFSFLLRAYWPEEAVTSGAWTPPPVKRA